MAIKIGDRQEDWKNPAGVGVHGARFLLRNKVCEVLRYCWAARVPI